jgi:hypothetical protein
MVGGASSAHAWTMTIQPNMKQRDLVRLAVLMCGDRPSAKYEPPAKGGHSASKHDPTLRYYR